MPRDPPHERKDLLQESPPRPAEASHRQRILVPEKLKSVQILQHRPILLLFIFYHCKGAIDIHEEILKS